MPKPSGPGTADNIELRDAVKLWIEVSVDLENVALVSTPRGIFKIPTLISLKLL
jgi:hypothetical protein